MEIADQGYMTQKDAAAVLGVSASTIRNMIKDGRIRGVVLSKRPMISSSAVRKLLEQGDDDDDDRLLTERGNTKTSPSG